jgi:hypothetical protein
LLMNQNEMSNLYRGPSIDASYQVSYHLAKWLQRKSCLRNRTNKKQELPPLVYDMTNQVYVIPLETPKII